MAASSIQGQLLQVSVWINFSVVRCTKLKNTEWISRQDPYVSLEYGGTKYRTRTHTDGGTNPVFQADFHFVLIGLKELKVEVWNSNTMKRDDFIGGGTINLRNVLSNGSDDTDWPLYTSTGRHAGEVRLMMRYSKANNSATSHGPSVPPNGNGASHIPNGHPYSTPPSSTASYAHSPASYYQSSSPYHATAYPHPPAPYQYNQTHFSAYPPHYIPPPTTYPQPYPGPLHGAYPPYY